MLHNRLLDSEPEKRIMQLVSRDPIPMKPLSPAGAFGGGPRIRIGGGAHR
ncbi:MAG: hypothetical protein U1F50_07030 [Rubrivivax sp.]